MPKRKRCPCCRRLFLPDPRVKERQITCGRRECRREQKRRSNERWRSQFPDYCLGMYPHQRQAYGTRAEYKEQYRKDHPEYVRRNAAFVREYRRRRAERESEPVSPTSCDLRLSVCAQTGNVSITQVSHTSRDIFVTVHQDGA